MSGEQEKSSSEVIKAFVYGLKGKKYKNSIETLGKWELVLISLLG